MRIGPRVWAIPSVLLLVAACASSRQAPPAQNVQSAIAPAATVAASSLSLPQAAPRDPAARTAPGRVRWSADSLAEDFTALMFHDEWGRARPRLARWEGRVRVVVRDEALGAYRGHVRDLVGDIAARAPGLDISFAESGEGEIEIRAASARAIAAASPGALCLMAADRGSWAERRARRASGTPRLFEAPEAITIFAPKNAPPWLLRACLNEEVMQALGPRNDLSWLEDSIFNDDAMHLAPTDFDFLMLRILYDPRLRQGMAARDARAAAKAVAASLGYGEAAARRASRRAKPRFDALIGAAARMEGAGALRRISVRAADAALDFVDGDHRRGAALVAAASAARRSDDPARAQTLLEEAVLVFGETTGPRSLRRADAEARLAALHLRRGDAARALALVDGAIGALAAARSEAALALSLRIKACALHRLGRPDEADAAAQSAMSAASSAFGPKSARVLRWSREFRSDGRRV